MNNDFIKQIRDMQHRKRLEQPTPKQKTIKNCISMYELYLRAYKLQNTKESFDKFLAIMPQYNKIFIWEYMNENILDISRGK